MVSRERDIEKKLVNAVREKGGWAVKLSAQWVAGIPDRLILLPQGKCCFIELKRPGAEPRPIQVRRARQLRALGFKVYVIDSQEKITEVINEISTT